jgi:flagellar basal body L-ring protein FlgH
MRKKSQALLAVAAASTLGVVWPTLGQNAPPDQNPNAYTISPAEAGVANPDSDSQPIPIGLGVERAGGSLLRAETGDQSQLHSLTTANASFYNVPEPKPKLLRKHDLVSIVINEATQFISNDVTDLQRDNSLDAIIDSYITLGNAGGGLSVLEHTPTTPLEMKASSQRQFQGNGNIQRQDSYTGRITAEVVDVKPNGTLILQATEDIKTDEEDQKVTLLGTCRVEDISPANTIQSNQLYNLSLNKQHKGAVKDTNTRGLVMRFLDWLKPF